jgi:2-hydroxycyclohexanecarboxyl-CoA dehydrogenase
MKRFEAKVAVVTGGGSGIGRATCLRFAEEGAAVAVAEIDEARGKEVAEEIGRAGGKAIFVRTDVADEESVRAAVARIAASLGRIDVLVNNAATDPGIRLSDMTMEDVRRTFEVNFFAAVAGTLAVVPGMIDRGTGIVVNVSSDGGRLPSPGPGIYPASKAALSAFTESVSFRAAPRGVRMHVVYPAWMPTAMGRDAIGRGLRAPPRLTRRTEEEVARLVLDRMGGRTVDISASRLIDAATVFRATLPRTYHFFRRTW